MEDSHIFPLDCKGGAVARFIDALNLLSAGFVPSVTSPGRSALYSRLCCTWCPTCGEDPGFC